MITDVSHESMMIALAIAADMRLGQREDDDIFDFLRDVGHERVHESEMQHEDIEGIMNDMARAQSEEMRDMMNRIERSDTFLTKPLSKEEKNITREEERQIEREIEEIFKKRDKEEKEREKERKKEKTRQKEGDEEST